MYVYRKILQQEKLLIHNMYNKIIVSILVNQFNLILTNDPFGFM